MSQPTIATRITGETKQEENGFILLAVLFLLVLVLLTLSIAAPKVAIDLRRDKELETMHRGLQYARAIRMYYKRFGQYPSTIDQLLDTNDMRFLRKRYLDPITGKDDWRLIHVGQALVPATGPFGQPLQQAGSSIAGQTASTGDNGSGTSQPSSSPFGNNSGTSFGSSPSSGNSSPGFSSGSGSAFGSSGSAFGSSGSAFGSGGSSTPGFGAGSNPLGTAAGNGSPTGSSGFGSPGATVGGGPIIGVGLPSTKASIKVFKKQTHYNQWEFVYDPSQDLGGMNGQTGAGMLQQNGTGNGIDSTTSGFGNTTGSTTGFGGSGFGGSPAPANPINGGGSSPSPTSPQ